MYRLQGYSHIFVEYLQQIPAQHITPKCIQHVSDNDIYYLGI